MKNVSIFYPLNCDTLRCVSKERVKTYVKNCGEKECEKKPALCNK